MSQSQHLTENSQQTYDESLVNDIRRNILKNNFIYQFAMGELVSALDDMKNEMHTKNQHRPIHQIYSRIKSPKSILDKLCRKGFELSVESVWENLYDVAGIRVVCPFINDVYLIEKLIREKFGEYIAYERDYIESPKENGYRSLHIGLEMPVKVPVKLDNYGDHMEVEKVKVEIQLRTIAMEFWASLEHSIFYKSEGIIDETLKAELKKCADDIACTDQRMQTVSDHVVAMQA